VFTGIVREIGAVESLEGAGTAARLRVRAPETAASTAVGDSVSISGACLTAVDVTGGVIAFDAVPETLSRTSLGGLEAGARVNVEPALRAGEPLGGHIVQGHVDGLATIMRVQDEGQGKRIGVEIEPALVPYVVEKGSVTLDGVSLTVAELAERGFWVALVPHTLTETTLGDLREGDRVNVEVDALARYVERFLAGRVAE
jgi:riboflavin synthase